ncbi:hypothetical protein J5N97_000929 [Dioscorea zingiberensis]|uniref:Uncharacterized protein n=1 Tax=Dioscorea zingiberensis TaxID=325984 RepID=A0A9D5H2T2_9LILI|nr:hypothetical protein J5N97_000929 [Dioscorea zingiberensis]
MATAEARAAWQRTAPRCFVQEDAKRAPKVACCPSSSSSLQLELNNSHASGTPVHSVPNFVNLNRNAMSPIVPPDTKWWLWSQPTLGCQKEYIYEPLNASKDEFEEKGVETSMSASELIVDALLDESLDVEITRADYPLDSMWTASATCVKSDCETEVEKLKAFNHDLQLPAKHKTEMDEYFFQDEELKGWEVIRHMISEKPEKGLDLKTSLTGGGKPEPWWRIADKDELASLVAHKSLQHIENCDLPRPTQTVPISTEAFACLESLDGNLIFSSSFGQKSNVGCCKPIELTPQSASRSCSGCNESNASTKSLSEGTPTLKADPSRAKLLEALCHSQTRARKAEIAAKKAHEEKEHIIKLLYRQASHLFGYKLWLHILQLESLCLQLKLKDNQISTILPFLPWMSFRGRSSSRARNETKMVSGKNQKNAIVSSIGLGLAGAGLLLGWIAYRRITKCTYETNHT